MVYLFSCINGLQELFFHISKLLDPILSSEGPLLERVQLGSHFLPELLELNQNLLDSGQALLDLTEVSNTGNLTCETR